MCPLVYVWTHSITRLANMYVHSTLHVIMNSHALAHLRFVNRTSMRNVFCVVVAVVFAMAAWPSAITSLPTARARDALEHTYTNTHAHASATRTQHNGCTVCVCIYSNCCATAESHAKRCYARGSARTPSERCTAYTHTHPQAAHIRPIRTMLTRMSFGCACARDVEVVSAPSNSKHTQKLTHIPSLVRVRFLFYSLSAPFEARSLAAWLVTV